MKTMDSTSSDIQEPTHGTVEAGVPMAAESPAGSPGVDVEDLYTLSPMQQGMLFHILSAPEDRLYLDQTLCTILGELEEGPFRAAWQKVVDRHPALRTGFLWQGLSKPLQVVYRHATLDFESHDWRQLSPKVQKAQLEAFLREDRQRGFDLRQAPLMRVHVLRLGDRSYRVLWTVYHLVVDAWCSTTVLTEVVRCYEALRRGEEPNLPAVQPYRNFIRWLKGREVDADEEFWRSYLEGFHRPTPVAQHAKGDSWPGLGSGHRHERLELSEAETHRLKELARGRHLTLGSLIQGAWGLLLSYRSEQDDVVFGTTVSGRPAELSGATETVGLFINTLPHRLRIEPQAELIPWLQELQDRQLEVREREQTPLHRIQSWSEVEGASSLFHSIVVFLNVADLAQQDTGSLYIKDLRYVGRPHLPLTVNVFPGRRLSVEMVYEVRRFRWAEVRRWLDQLETLLKAMAERPEASLGEILETLRHHEQERRSDQRRRRRDSNSGMLRITRPVAVKLTDIDPSSSS